MKTRVDNLAIARAVKKARAEMRAEMGAKATGSAAATTGRKREAVVLYQNGSPEFQLATPLHFSAAQDAVDFAALLGGMFPAYQFFVAPAKEV